MNLGCIIISNSDDLRFLRAGLKEITPTFSRIVLAIGTKLWNGEPEDESKIADFCKDLPCNVKVLRYNVPEDMISIMKGSVRPEMYWEGHARWMAYKEISDVDYLLLLDSDEIVDGESFNKWLATGEYKKYSAMKLRNFWYWREPENRAIDYYEDSVVFIKNGTFNPLHFFSNMGRHGVFDSSNGLKTRELQGIEGIPMIHHYSWVRNKEQMMRKVKAWGHRNDRTNWEALVEEEFSRPFNGTDFLKQLKYEVVPNKYNI